MNKAQKNESTLETLLEQYKIAIDLYKHEDNLNWRKLNHLFYVNAGLWAVIGFIIEHDFPNETFSIPFPLFTGMVSLIGLIVSVAFGIALWYGIEYMHSRKDVAAKIEDSLIQFGGKRIVSLYAESKKRKRYLKESPTTWMLRLVPILFSSIWFIVLLVIILRK